MAITSLAFVGFAVIVLLAYNAASVRIRPGLLLVTSLLFYASFSLRHLAVLLFVTLVAYVGGIALDRRTRWALPVAIVGALLPLFVFKYSGLVASIIRPGLSDSVPLSFALPVGLSFFTFQAVSYLVDVRRGRADAERDLTRVALHLALFPKLLAGPIERASTLLPQLRTRDRTSGLNLHVGAKLVLWGFFCKLVVADNVASIVDAVLKNPGDESGGSLAAAFTTYAFQIYFDFLGYTYIAIGIARCFNIHLTPNFLVPYSATSLREFWHRWHITLSSWFRDYVYVPLGGNRTRGITRLAQLLLVFTVSGLWHGAALTFVAWGAFHGIAYAVEDFGRRRLAFGVQARGLAPPWMLRAARRTVVFTIVTLGWILFRSPDFSTVGIVLSRIAVFDESRPWLALNDVFCQPDSRWFLVLMLAAIMLDASSRFRAVLEEVPNSGRRLAGELAYVNLFAVSLVLLGDLGIRDFTYFQF